MPRAHIMSGSGDCDDLMEMVRLATPHVAAPPAGDAMEADEEVAAAAAAVAVENEDLALVVAIDAARPVRKYGQRSWQLLEKARAAKRQKAVQEAMGAEAKARAKAEAALSLAQAGWAYRPQAPAWVVRPWMSTKPAFFRWSLCSRQFTLKVMGRQ